MSSARVLYVHTTGVSSEILKNLVLAGVKAAICDGRPYPSSMATTPSSFLPPGERDGTSKEETGDTDKNEKEDKTSEPEQKKQRTSPKTVAAAMQPRVMELNPLLDECKIYESSVEDIPDEEFAKYDVVVASRLGMDQAKRVSAATTSGGGKFYLVDCFGLSGCAMLDLGPDHGYRKEVGKDKLSDVMKVDPYVPLGDMLNLKLRDATGRWDKLPPKIWATYRAYLEYEAKAGKWSCADYADDFVEKTQQWLKTESEKPTSSKPFSEDYLGNEDDLRNIASLATAEVSPVCAVLGGVLGNEIIKAISGRGEPANNILLFDGVDGGCRSFLLQEKNN
uniref:THIF-type NAD/FAD binding fold domain-containing protein n=1 Tax=Ditylum brightwellii TaxID=49249 RepID=A0A7S1YV53_9STRA